MRTLVWKKTIIAQVFLLVMAIVPPLFAIEFQGDMSGPKVVMDGKLLSFDVPPTVQNGRTLVPVRAIFEAMGAKVNWDGASNTVTAAKAGTEIKITVGGKAFKNGVPVVLDVPSMIIGGRTMVPLRFVGEAMGCLVRWNDSTQTVIISSANKDSGKQSTGKINLTKSLFGNSRLPILMFHTVNTVKLPDALDPHWEWSFRELADRMYKEGYKTITVKQAYDFNVKGIQMPEKSVWLTFDDGYTDNLTVAAPILADYGYTATIFIETSKIGGNLRLTYPQIELLRNKYGWDVQLHGHVGHLITSTNGSGGKGSFYNDLKWLEELSRVETMEERHARVKADLQKSIDSLKKYNDIYGFAYPSNRHGATPGIKSDNDAVMKELGIMGVNVGKTGNEQIVTMNTTTRNNLCRIGIAGDTRYEKIFNTDNFGVVVRVGENGYNTRFPVYDNFNDRFVIGTINGKIMTVGKNWIPVLEPTAVLKPGGSARPDPASFIVPAILSNGDIWVGSITGSALYKLDLKDFKKPASREIGLGFLPYNLISDGMNLYAFDTSGVVTRIDTESGATSTYCTLPRGEGISYTGAVLKNGILYVYESKNNNILKYDFIKKGVVRNINWDDPNKQLQPWHVIDDNNILCFSKKEYRHMVLEYR